MPEPAKKALLFAGEFHEGREPSRNGAASSDNVDRAASNCARSDPNRTVRGLNLDYSFGTRGVLRGLKAAARQGQRMLVRSPAAGLSFVEHSSGRITRSDIHSEP